MALYAIGDLHLSFGVPGKSMDVFGGEWQGHEEKIRKNWLAEVCEEDSIVLMGDFSWGRSLEQCAPDFDFVRALPGRKIFLRGNHDMFWDAKRTQRLNDAFRGEFFFLQDNYAAYGDCALVGTKGICFENLTSFDRFLRLEERETERLRRSFEAARADGYNRFIVFLHYPPSSCVWPPTPELCRAIGMSAREERILRERERTSLLRRGWKDDGHNLVIDLHALPKALLARADEATQLLHSPFTEMAEEYGVEQVLYAHCHGKKRFHDSLRGQVHGIRYSLASSDSLDFRPMKVLD